MIEIILNYINERLLGGHYEVPVTAEDDLLENGLVDSMGMMSLIGFIEEKFKVKVPPQEMVIENFQTVKSISKYLEQTGPHDEFIS